MAKESKPQQATYYELIYSDDIIQYEELKVAYLETNDENLGGAFNLAQLALALSDRWSEIAYEVRKLEAQHGKDVAFRDRAYERYRTLQEMHTHCRMMWGKAEERTKGRGEVNGHFSTY